MKKIIFLDRNVISTIKKKLNGKRILDHMDRSIRLLDKSDHLITPFLSIREGQSGISENYQEMKETLVTETSIISRFFKNAKTDSSFLMDKKDEFTEIFSNHTELKWDNYRLFLHQARSILLQTVAKQDRNKYRDQIFSIASENEVTPSHPVVICCLSVLYGCTKTKRIINPKLNETNDQKDKAIYNALNDIIAIARVAMFKAVFLEDKRSTPRFEFFTFDNGLSFFYNSINVKQIKNIQGEKQTSSMIEISCKPSLFPDLDKNSFEELMTKIQRESKRVGESKRVVS